jgi:tRNA nucleotidyltransferase (CCA-adding enzyme)
MTHLPLVVFAIAEAVRKAGGRLLVVGGAVRDALLGMASKDCDLEVYGLDEATLRTVLLRFGEVNAVGSNFGVLKLRAVDRWMRVLELDVSLPRRENKAGRGHKGFLVAPDPTMTPQEAAARRDFTINALAEDPLTGERLDFFGGAHDLHAGILRHTSAAFAEDPLRVLRGMQFAARFAMQLDAATAALCRRMLPEADTLAVERIWGEWEKWAQRGTLPSAGLEVLRATGWLVLYPELAALVGCLQDAQYHPEGDVWAHTQHVVNAAAQIATRDGVTGDDRLVLLVAALCHDLGKPKATVIQSDGRITSYGHDTAGETPTRQLLGRIGVSPRLIERVVVLVREHMVHVSLDSVSPRVVRRLAQRLATGGETIQMLARVIEADHTGRPPLPGGLPPRMQEIVSLAEQLTLTHAAPAPILMGRHLLARGLQPGRAMGTLLHAAYDAQLDGAFTDLPGALVWLEEREG